MPRPPEGHIVDLDRVVSRELPNGLRVRLLEDRNAPTVSYYTFFQVGSRNERPGITGISHLFEHMMFNGAKKYGPKEFDRVLESQRRPLQRVHLERRHRVLRGLRRRGAPDGDRPRVGPDALARAHAGDARAGAQVVKEERRLRVDNEIFGLMDEELEHARLQGAPVPLAGHRLDGGHRAHHARGLRSSTSAPTTRPTTPRSTRWGPRPEADAGAHRAVLRRHPGGPAARGRCPTASRRSAASAAPWCATRPRRRR